MIVTGQIETLLQPLVLVFETKNAKAFIPALNCLQKMASSFSLSDSGIVTILSMLRDASSESLDEMTQIKILQIILIFLNPNQLRLTKDFVDLVLQCCFQMFYSKSNSVKSTIQATLRQLLTLVFDTFVNKCKEASQNEEFFDLRRRLHMSIEERQQTIQKIKTIETQSVFKICFDLVSSISQTLTLQEQNDKKSLNSQIVWNLTPSVPSKCMLMDLISLILNQTQDILQFFPSIVKIFDSEIIPILEQMFKVKSQEYIIGMRLMKCSIMIMNNLGIGINLLHFILIETDSLITRGKDGSTNLNLTWKSLIGFECLAIAFNNPNLIKIFSQSALQVGKTVLVQMFESLAQATENLDLSGDLNQRHMLTQAFQHQKTPKFIEAQNLESEMQPPQPAQIHKLIIEATCFFVENLIILFDNQGLRIGGTRGRNSTAGPSHMMPQIKGQLDCKELLLLSWKPLLNVLQNLLLLTNDESNIQNLLNSYQNFIGVCGSVSCFEARDEFLESLCGFCLTEKRKRPEQTSQGKLESSRYLEEGLKEKNIQICKTLLNIAHCLGNILDVKSWYIILETMQRIENVIKIKLKAKMRNMQNPAINQAGQQTLVDFSEIKNKVQEKMKEYNMFEKQKSDPHEKEEEKKDILKIHGASSTTLAGVSETFSPFEESKERQTNQMQKKNTADTIKVRHSRGGSISKNQDVLQIKPQPRLTTHSEAPQDHKASQYESTPSQNSSVNNSMQFDPLTTDLQILQDSFDSLFTSSLLFDTQSLAELITSLGQLTVGVLENISGSKKQSEKTSSGMNSKSSQNVQPKQQPNESEVLANINTFAISRLVETALVNISRIEQIWKILIAHFDILTNCKVQMLRTLSIEALQCIILEIFSYRKNQTELKLQKVTTSSASPNVSRGSGVTRSRNSKKHVGQNEENDDDLDMEVDENWSGTVWQYTILTPFSDQLKSQHNSNKIQTLKGLEKIIQTCGQQIKNDGWRIIIVTISKTPEIDNDQVVSTGFRCLKLIVSNYIDKLSQENFITILHAIHKYASNEGENINNNLTAVGMFQNVADYTAKHSQKEVNSQSSQESGSQILNPQRIWTILVEKVQELGSDLRVEIRRANIHTFENIIMTHGQLISESVWNQMLKNVCINLLKNSLDAYIQSKGGIQISKPMIIEGGLPTPSFSFGGFDAKKKNAPQKKKMNFDDETVMKALQKNNDEQWEETCVLLLQTFLRAIKKYNSLEEKKQEVVDFVWINLISILSDMIKNGSQEICSTIYKTLEDIFSSQSNCIDLFMSHISQSLKILEATSEWLGSDKIDIIGGSGKKPMNLKLCPVIIETLKKLYSLNIVSDPNKLQYASLINPQNCQILLQLLFKMIRSQKNNSEGFQGMGMPHKLLSEEKITFEFIENLNDIVKKNPQSQLMYLKFLFSFTDYDPNEPHSEAFIRRVFSLLNNIILQGKVPIEILKEILPLLYDKIEKLIDLRYHNEACMGLVFPSKGSQTLFYSVGLYAMHFSSFLISPKHFKSRMTNHFKQIQEQQRGPTFGVQTSQISAGSTGGYTGGLKAKTNSAQGEDFISSNDIMFQEQLEFSVLDPAVIANQSMTDSQLKQMVWERVIPLLKYHLLFNPDKVLNHNKAVIEDVVKSSQDLDMQVMNFITNSLLPNCADINDKDFHQSLVGIIDNGCNSVYSSQRLSQGVSTSTAFGNSLSKYCLNNLFELCRYQSPKQGDEEADVNERKIFEIRKKIATITTPVLINRCRDTLKKYSHDESKSGSISLPRQRINEAVFILEKLRSLDCYPEVQPQQYKSKKGHLVQLMPIFADLVLSNEALLKDHLRQIFLDISESIAQSRDLTTQKSNVGDSSGGEF